MIHMIPQLLVEMVPRKFLENTDIATCMRLVSNKLLLTEAFFGSF